MAALFMLVVLSVLSAAAVRLDMSQLSSSDLNLAGVRETLVANSPTVTVFSVTAIASHGLYGSPEFVSRQRTVRITP